MRFRLARWINKDSRVELQTTEQRILADIADKLQQILTELRKKNKAGKKPEKTGKRVEMGWRPEKSDLDSPPGFKKEKTKKPSKKIKPDPKIKPPTYSKTREGFDNPFKKDGTS